MAKNIDEILQIGVQKAKASDIHLKVGLPPMYRISGSLKALKGGERLTSEDIKSMIAHIATEFQQKRLIKERELDMAYGIAGLGRFRVNIYYQRNSLAMAVRTIPMEIPNFEGLRLPKVLKKIADDTHRGMILVTGTTSSGKSSTLAAMIDYINQTKTKHIITIEDPIEFLFGQKSSIINQRELGVDTLGFAAALKSAMRQDPDIILIGEMRDLETIETAIHAAETGHLVLSTLHTMDASETINRIISIFPPHQQKTIRLQLTSILKAVISQRLVPSADGRSRVPAVEVMLATQHIRELMQDEERLKEIREAIAAGHSSYGMQTFDQSLMSLVKRELISYDEALLQATNPADFELRYKGIASSDGNDWGSFEDDDADADLDDMDDEFEIER